MLSVFYNNVLFEVNGVHFKIQNGHQRSTLKNFVGAKTLKLRVRNNSNFTITFPMIWKCAGDFFKVLLKFKMAATDQL